MEQLIAFSKELVRAQLREFIRRFASIEDDVLEAQCEKGVVEFHNLKLKPEALRELGLPLSVQCGVISYFRLLIPWRTLTIDPAMIVIEGLNISAAPMDKNQWEQRSAELIITATKNLEAKLRQFAERGVEKRGWARRRSDVRRIARGVGGMGQGMV